MQKPIRISQRPHSLQSRRLVAIVADRTRSYHLSWIIVVCVFYFFVIVTVTFLLVYYIIFIVHVLTKCITATIYQSRYYICDFVFILYHYYYSPTASRHNFVTIIIIIISIVVRKYGKRKFFLIQFITLKNNHFIHVLRIKDQEVRGAVWNITIY